MSGIAGLTKKKPLSTATQNYLKLALGSFALFIGLRLTWTSLHGSFLQILKQLGLVLLALVLGKLTGRLLRLQKASNGLGHVARLRINQAKPSDPNRFNSGFLTCSLLYCAAPLGIIGAICDGLPVGDSAYGFFYPLAVKALMDGLATMGFVSVFGWGALLSAVPVLVFQGTITLLCARFLLPALGTAPLEAVHAAAGLLICSVGLLILEVRKIEATDYLPSLALAPLLAWWLNW